MIDPKKIKDSVASLKKTGQAKLEDAAKNLGPKIWDHCRRKGYKGPDDPEILMAWIKAQDLTGLISKDDLKKIWKHYRPAQK